MLKSYTYNELIVPLYQYQSKLKLAIMNDFHEYIEYIFERIPSPVNNDIDLFFQSILQDKLWAVKRFVNRREVNPSTATYSNKIDVYDVFQAVIQLYNIDDDEILTSQSLLYASAYGMTDITQWLITEAKVRDKDCLCLHVACYLGKIDTTLILLQYGNYHFMHIEKSLDNLPSNVSDNDVKRIFNVILKFYESMVFHDIILDYATPNTIPDLTHDQMDRYYKAS